MVLLFLINSSMSGTQMHHRNWRCAIDIAKKRQSTMEAVCGIDKLSRQIIIHLAIGRIDVSHAKWKSQ